MPQPLDFCFEPRLDEFLPCPESSIMTSGKGMGSCLIGSRKVEAQQQFAIVPALEIEGLEKG